MHGCNPAEEGDSWELVASQRALRETLFLNVTWGVTEEHIWCLPRHTCTLVQLYACMHPCTHAHACKPHNTQNGFLNENRDEWSNRSAVKRMWYFRREPSSDPSIHVGSSQLLITPTSGKPNTSCFLVYLDS